mmetsp:Transcript_12019/g.36643  ORF Transcript_12019/g.36643 Transcript_12019/m.36643 type:complete len:459 (+) Transcript_12019:369-1745(+)|eukprot:CAMPEP_0198725272 /NCGR_PEP_ID=MMETSP1475-20131203/2614_1 /TAXON_ID= ORGANISM="Unidentified sp., Strain CCMP1999" /NCGR_SAMPLE_ID=MMETSP1475 /ASSEMBLY_ACC=CAM_ASM_001111 /LENGTH=458 /DNA_ID=CAMNT_0044487015 /DNA_START=359 /DNA_END=1735 /DNA_ORIENTATION=-
MSPPLPSDNRLGSKYTWRSFVRTYLISVATILGTGILGLPVSLYRTGFVPFMVVFSLALVAQLVVVNFAAQLLYGVHRVKVSAAVEDERIGLFSHSNSDSTDDGPSLSALSQVFLPNRILRWLFSASVMLHFASIMIAYGIAIPRSYRLLFAIRKMHPLAEEVYRAAAVGSLSLVIAVALPLVIRLISVATAAKGSLLAVLITLVGFYGLRSRLNYTDNWRGLMTPFLLGSVAIGGVVNVMPVTYNSSFREKPTKSDLQAYQLAVSSAVVTCFLFNILWCLSVLLLVPQVSGSPDEPSLQAAYEAGAISTEPLVEILGRVSRMRFIVNLFTAVSVTVSFLVMGAGMQNMISAEAAVLSAKLQLPLAYTRNGLVTTWCGFVLVVTVANPKAFLSTMEVFTSFALNLESGIFIVFMFFSMKAGTRSRLELVLAAFAMAYFSSACLLDMGGQLVRLCSRMA